MKTKLIDKTTRAYLAISLTVLLVSIPFFYVTVENLWIEDVDDSLLFQKEKIRDGIEQNNLSTEDINSYIRLAAQIDDGVRIKQLQSIAKESDSIYYNNAYDSIRGHVEPFRELCAYLYINDIPYQITLQRDLVESEDLVWGIILLELAIFTLLISLTLFISIRYFRRIWNPFYEITNQLKHLNLHEKGELNAVDCKEIAEFDDLKTSVNELIHRNYIIFQSQKEFAENAAHEMQTPLAVIKSQVSMLTDMDMNEKQLQHLFSIDRNVKHQSHLVKGLLLLSKLENNQFILADNVAVAHVINSCYELVKEELELCHIPFEIDIRCQTILAKSNLMLFTTLLNGLLNNSIKHGATPNTLTITLDKNQLQLSNQGKDTALDETKIFHRFYKEEADASGTGLGLSIVSQIGSVLGYTIKYTFTAPNIHTFTILFRA